MGVLIAVPIEISGYAGGGAEEVLGALGRGALIGGFFGVFPGVVCGIELAVSTLAFRQLPERTDRYRMIAAAACAGVVIVPAGLSALIPYDEGVGMMFFIPTPFQIIGIPLLVFAPFCVLAAQRVARIFSRRVRAGSR